MNRLILSAAFIASDGRRRHLLNRLPVVTRALEELGIASSRTPVANTNVHVPSVDSLFTVQPEATPPKKDAPAAAAEEEVNTGQDPTKPLTRLDIRLKYQNLPGGGNAVVPTARLDVPFPIGDTGWTLGTRVDLPFVASNVASSDNASGDWHVGLGDALAQVLAITPPQGRWQFAFGTQLLLPTGSQEQMTTGKWQLAPIAAGVYAIPEISKGSFAALLVKDQFSIAGDSGRSDIHDLVIQPIFNVNLPDMWFLNFSPEMRFNMKDDGKAFIPLAVMVGKMINPKTVVSVEGKVPIVNDYKQYDFEIEFRIGFFF